MESLVSKIHHYEQKLNKIPHEYNTSMLSEWPAIREKEVYFIRMLYKLKKDKDLYDEKINSQLIKEQKAKVKSVDLKSHKAKEVPQNDIMKDSTIDKEAQTKVNESYPLESYEEEEENNVQSHNDFINSLGEEEIHNIENAMDALEIKDEETSDLKEARTELMDPGDCEHDWIKGRGDYNIKCAFCIYYPSQDNRFTCSVCLKQACASCLRNANQKWRREIEIIAEDKILASRVRNLEN
ncbi:hypothetical protein SEVIR_8G088201v4 [Setaria viridis]